MLCFEKKMRNRRYTYENNFRIKKNFLKYLIRSQNVKFIDFYNEHPYSNMILEDSTEKNPIFLANRPPKGLKDAESSWKTTKILPFSNIYFRCRDILILVFPQSA